MSRFTTQSAMATRTDRRERVLDDFRSILGPFGPLIAPFQQPPPEIQDPTPLSGWEARQLENFRWRKDVTQTYSIVSALLVTLTFGTILPPHDGKHSLTHDTLTALCGATSCMSLITTLGFLLITVFLGKIIEAVPIVQFWAVARRYDEPAAVILRTVTWTAFVSSLVGLAGVYGVSIWVSLPEGKARIGVGSVYGVALWMTFFVLQSFAPALRRFPVSEFSMRYIILFASSLWSFLVFCSASII